MTLSRNDIARLRGLARFRRDRHEAGRFVVEGPKLVAEVVASDLAVHSVIGDEHASLPTRLADQLGQRGVAPVLVPTAAIARMASTTTPQPWLAEVAMPTATWDVLHAAGPTLVAVGLNDPGNVGTLVRSAEAAGFAAFVALGETADPWSPKAIRASAGALFRVPTIIEGDVAHGLTALADLGFERIGTRMQQAMPCDEVDLTGSVALLVGSEAHGLAVEHADHVDRWVSIPMAGRVESLNVAMAGTILSYEVARQRRASGRQ